jgi:hypothetical protein
MKRMGQRSWGSRAASARRRTLLRLHIAGLAHVVEDCEELVKYEFLVFVDIGLLELLLDKLLQFNDDSRVIMIAELPEACGRTKGDEEGAVLDGVRRRHSPA